MRNICNNFSTFHFFLKYFHKECRYQLFSLIVEVNRSEFLRKKIPRSKMVKPRTLHPLAPCSISSRVLNDQFYFLWAHNLADSTHVYTRHTFPSVCHVPLEDAGPHTGSAENTATSGILSQQSKHTESGMVTEWKTIWPLKRRKSCHMQWYS